MRQDVGNALVCMVIACCVFLLQPNHAAADPGNFWFGFMNVGWSGVADTV
jgi:hypothetical protein